MQEYEKRVLKKASHGRVHRLFRCPRCMSPLLLMLLFRWHDGVISLRLLNRDFRFAFIESDMLNEVIDLLVERFGEEQVAEIARKAERGSATGYISLVLAAEQWWLKPVSYVLRYSFLLNYILELNCSFLGYGAADLIEKKLPDGMVFMRNPYNKMLFQADIEACYMLARDRDITIRFDPVCNEQGIYVYWGKAETERSPGSFRQYKLQTKPVVSVDNPYGLTRCPRCGVPSKVSRFWWDARSGVISHKDTGKRLIFWPCYALERMLVALHEQLGDEAGELIFNTVKEYEKRSISGGGIGFTTEEQLEFIMADRRGQYELLLKQMSCMGFGHGEVVLEEPDRVKVTMTNALVPEVNSGLIAGMAEALEDKPVEVSWEEGPRTTTYTLRL